MATLKGKWRFNETIVPPDADIEQAVNFTTSGTLNDTAYTALNCISMLVDVSSAELLKYKVSSATPEWDSNEAYYGAYSNGLLGIYGFFEEGMRIVYFGETEQEVTDEFFAWFTANAAMLRAATIKYGDQTISVLDGGQTATLECAGLFMTENVTIRAEAVSAGGGDEVPVYDNRVEIIDTATGKVVT